MKVHVQNFQSLKDAQLDVEGLTVIVGPSDLGKSALVRAIEAALFNLPGDYFVRAGATFAEVHLAEVPTAAGGTLDVVWRKGKGKNEFVVNGAKFDKVGTDAPPPLVVAGFRDVAEEVRPQIATQFDRLFLLDRPGSTVADILTALSRVVVVAAADRLCATDVRDTKRTETVRRGDLQQVETDLIATREIDDLHARVQRTKALHGQVEAQTRTCAAVADAVRLRQGLHGLGPHLLPAPVELPAMVVLGGHHEQQVRALVEARRTLVPAASGALPEGLASEALDTLARNLEALAALRMALQARPARTLELPVPTATRFEQLADWSRTADTLRQHITDRAAALADLRTAEGTAKEAHGAHAEAVAAFEMVLTAAKVCPLCGKVVDDAHAHA